MLWVLVACTVVPYHKPVDVAPVGVTAPPANQAIDPLLQRVDRALASTTETDARDRLVELRDLLVSVQLANPAAQESVVKYADRVLVIEERSRPFGLAESPMELEAAADAVVVEETVDDPLAAARAALASGAPLDAVAAVDALGAAGLESGAQALRGSAVELWCRTEKEAAGAAFIAAKAAPAGAARQASIAAVAARLSAINTRFPNNPYAQEVAQHLATVQKELP